MTAQPPLPGFAPVPDKPPRRRSLWQAEMRRALAILVDERARDRQQHAKSLALVQGQLSDIRQRLADLERAAGLADLTRAPAGRDALRRFAGGRA
ncbi:MAG: hypothetical protein ACREE4_22505 [Stellaceae bacterium]